MNRQAIPTSINLGDEVSSRNLIERWKTNHRKFSLTDKGLILEHLINFMKNSPFFSCRKTACDVMGWYYFEDLKDMQETAVDAVYDFCEDSEQQIRLLGYNALHEIVARNSYWTERNVDVLVQLLRNDEAKERQVIIDSIEKCILHDPAGTLHVVFEYATIPQQEKEDFDMDLRNAVLEIMAPSFARRTFEGLATHPTQLESVGTDIIKLVETTSPKETVALMDVLLLRLTEKFPQSTLASKLNTALVKKMAATFESETSALGPARTTALPITTSLLEVAASIARTQETNPTTVLPVVGFASNTLLASKVVESIIPEDRYTIASIALGLFLGVKDRDESATANVRVALAQRFGLLVDILVHDGLSKGEEWEMLHTLVVFIALPTWGSSKTKEHKAFESHIKTTIQLAERQTSAPEAAEIVAALKKLDSRPPLRRPPPTNSTPSSSAPPTPTNAPSPVPSLKRKGAPASMTQLPVEESSDSLSLLQRMQPTNPNDRKSKRAKVEPSLLDRMRLNSATPTSLPSSPAPISPSTPSPSASPSLLERTGSAGKAAVDKNARAARVSAANAPYAAAADARGNKNSRVASTQSLTDSLQKSSINEPAQGNRRKGNANASNTLPPAPASASLPARPPSPTSTPAPADAPPTLSIRGAANKPKTAPVQVDQPSERPPPPPQRPSLLERAGLQTDTPAPPKQNNRQRLNDQGPNPNRQQKPSPNLKDRMAITNGNGGGKSNASLLQRVQSQGQAPKKK